MSWFDKLMPSRVRTDSRNRGSVPEGLWVKCESCTNVLYTGRISSETSMFVRVAVIIAVLVHERDLSSCSMLTPERKLGKCSNPLII